jgi:hypothetical protein
LRVFGCSASFWRRHSSSSRKSSAPDSPAEHGLARRHLRQQVVEVVAAERADPRAGDDGVRLVVQLHHRGVEGAAPEVVHEETAVELLAMTEFDGRRRGLVQEAQHLKARPAERLDGQEPLIAIGIGGHAEHHLERRVEAEAALQLGDHLGEQLHQGIAGAVHLDARVRAGILEDALERSHRRPARLALHRSTRPIRSAARRPGAPPGTGTSLHCPRACRRSGADSCRDRRRP